MLLGWLQALAIAFAIGWLVFDPFIILCARRPLDPATCLCACLGSPKSADSGWCPKVG